MRDGFDDIVKKIWESVAEENESMRRWQEKI
jgi:hypothetical protein